MVAGIFTFAASMGTAAAATLFSDGFESGSMSGWGYVMPSCGVGTSTPHIAVGPSPVRTGTYASTVVASDSYKNAYGLEACELSDLSHAGYDLGQDQYYGASYRFPSPYTQPLGWGGVISQFGYTGTITSPPLSLVLLNGGIKVQINGGKFDPGYTGSNGLCGNFASSGYPYTCNYPGDAVVSTISPGTWYDIIIHVKWSTTGRGALDVWVRQQGQSSFIKVVSRTGITTQTWETGVCDINGLTPTGTPCHPYDKLGIYRDGGAGTQADTVINEDNFSYSTTYTEATASFPSPPSAPVSTTVPTITGVPQSGHTLATSTGTWSNSPTSYAFQWSRCDSAGANCVAVAGASSSIYALGSADVGDRVVVTVTATNAGGSASATSLPTTAVSAPPPVIAPPRVIAITLAGHKTWSGWEKVAIGWTGARTAYVTLYRNGALLATTTNSRSYTDNLRTKNAGSYTYYVCESGTSNCSASKTVTFRTTITVPSSLSRSHTRRLVRRARRAPHRATRST